MKISIIGTVPITNARAISLKDSIFVLSLLKKYDNKNISPIFANSDGWNPKGPKSIQLFDPYTLRPMKRTATRKNKLSKYEGKVKRLIALCGKK